jgi:hypothetical protein
MDVSTLPLYDPLEVRSRRQNLASGLLDLIPRPHPLIHWSEIIWGEPWGIDPGLSQDSVSKKVYLNIMAPNNNGDRIWEIYQCEVDVKSGKCVDRYSETVKWNYAS